MKDLYRQIRSGHRLAEYYGELIHFHGVPEYTVYNATPPVWIRVFGKMESIIVGRVEKLDEWSSSHVHFFRRIDEHNYGLMEEIRPIIDKNPSVSIEDPSIITVQEEIILGVVRATHLSDDHSDNIYDIKTSYYRGFDLSELEQFAVVEGKDSRICPVENGKIIWTPRPQGSFGGLGTIGYCELSSVDDLVRAKLDDVNLIEGLFSEGTWGGVNELHFNPANPSIIGAVCHGAFQDIHGKVYFVFWTVIDRPTQKVVDVIPLALRDDFPPTNAKLQELERVVFAAGIQYPKTGPPRLYGGLGDAYQGYVPITHPQIVNFYN